MRILVGIPSHGHRNRPYLDAVLGAYRAVRGHCVHVVVLSDVPKDLGPDVEVRVGTPTDNPMSLPFAHRSLFVERSQLYDLFIYGEDDTLVRQQNIDAFIALTPKLAADELVGFVRSEEDSAGLRTCSSLHSHHHWDPASTRRRGDDVFARLTNDHAACYMLTRSHLRRAIDSGGFLVPPHQGRYGMLETAATDVYTQCGFTRLVCLSRLDDFLLPHLPNKYLGRLGMALPELRGQVEALLEIERGVRSPQRLFSPAPSLTDGLFERYFYEPRRDDVLALVPPGARSILSVGAGWGETEAALRDRGADVTAVPLDEVVAESARRRGLRVLPADLDEALSLVPDGSCDCLLFCDVLQHFGDPAGVLARCARVLRPGGHVVISAPNAECVHLRRLGRQAASRVGGRAPLAEGVYRSCRAEVRRWVSGAGLRATRVTAPPPTATTAWGRQAQRWWGRWLSRWFLVLAVKDH